MTNRERVITSLSHKQPDKVPFNIDFTQKARANMVKFYDDPQFTEKLGNCFTVVETEPADSWKEVRPDVWGDQFGVQWDRTVDKDIGVVCNRLVSPENVDEFPFPDPDDPSRYKEIQAVVHDKALMQNDRFVVADLGFSLYERAWTLTGMENLMMAMILDKPFADRLLDRILEFNLGVIENACSYDIDMMRFGDDWGMQTGLQMGPELWREFIKPRVREMYRATKAKGKYVLIHCCGKVDELFPDLIECGLDVFNPFQPEVMDVYDVKRRYGDRLSFYGGISIQNTLPNGTVEQTRTEVNRLLEEIGKNGGYIAAPSHAIPWDAKPENIAAMLEILQNQ